MACSGRLASRTTALSARSSPVLAARSRCSTVAARAAPKDTKAVNPAVIAAGISSAALMFPQIVSAAQEIAVVAEGEPLIVQAGWSALAVSFSFSLACVVWGRSGL